MKLSIIIVNYNVKHYLEQCLHSIYKAITPEIPTEIIVVDNASHDGSIQHIDAAFPQAQYPNLHIIKNARNVGFGKANNQAAAKATGEYILFLNPDTILTENTLKETIQHADAHPDAGGIGTMMLYSNGKFANESRRGLPTPWTAFCKMTGLCTLIPKSKIFGQYYMGYLDKESPAEIEIISGAFLLARRSALEKTGLFDERFFMYGEDIDLSYRLLQQGYKNHYIPSPIIHYKGESTQKSTFRYVHIFYSAMLIFFKKHYGKYGLLLSLPINAAIILKAIIAVTLQYINRARLFLFPQEEKQNGSYIYIGRNSEKIKPIAERWCLDIEYIEGDETQATPNRSKKANYIIYDTSDFSYNHIVQAQKNSNHKTRLCTFNPDNNTIITDSEIFTLTNNE